MLFYYILYFCSIFAVMHAVPTCDLKLCNYEGDCQLVNSRPSCSCVPKVNSKYEYFKGAACTQLVDNCAIQGCDAKNAACVNRFGEVYCNCPPDLSGPLCNLKIKKQDFIEDIILHINQLAVIGTTQNVWTMAKNLGNYNLKFQYEINTLDYDVIYFNADRKLEHFQYSNNLAAVAKNLGLMHTDTFPYNKGYYRVTEYTFWLLGLNTARVIVTIPDGQKYFINHTVFVYQRSNNVWDCVPQIRIPSCFINDTGMILSSNTAHVIEVEVTKRCVKNSKLDFHWRLTDVMNKTTHYDWGWSEKMSIKIPPYFFKFPYGHSLLHYALEAEMVERTKMTTHTIKKICYVMVLVDNPTASIVGGTERSVGYTQPVILNGEKSRNYRYSPDEDQHLEYKWDCESTEKNEYCKKDVSYNAILEIKAGKLAIGSSYTFSLTVTTDFEKLSATTQQKVTIINDAQLTVDIVCVRNCQNNMFAGSLNIELRAASEECKGKNTYYLWKLNGKGIGNTEFLTYKSSDSPSLGIVLQMECGSARGQAEINLSKYTAPSLGSCKISPQQGFIFQTVFRLNCSNFQTEAKPLSYEFWAGTMMLSHGLSSSPEARISSQVTKVDVKVCDSSEACVETYIRVSLQKFEVPKDVDSMREMLKESKTNLKTMVENGQKKEALALTNTLVQNTTNPEVLSEVLKQLKKLDLDTFEEVVQFNEITKNINKAMKPLDSKKADIMTGLFKKTINGIQNMLEDQEAEDLSGDNYRMIANETLDLVHDFSQKFEEFQNTEIDRQVPYNTDDLEEQFGALENFSESTVERIEEWARPAEELNKLTNALGQLAVTVLRPDEEPLIVGPPGSQTEVSAIGNAKNVTMESRDSALNITLGAQALEELRTQLHNKQVLLQLGTMEKNPYWWYPGEQHLATKVVTFQTFGNVSKNVEDMDFENSFLLSMNRTPHKPIPLQSGKIRSRLMMPIHRVTLPPNALFVVTFTNTTVDLQVLLKLKEKPRGYEVRASQDIVNTTSGHTNFSILNNNCVENIAYVAVLSADVIDATDRTYIFYTSVFECVTWSWTRGDPKWISDGCIPVEEMITPETFACRCNHLPASSSFAGKSYTTRLELAPHQREILEELPLNCYMIGIYAVIAASTCGLLGLALAQLKRRRHLDYLFIEPDADVKGENCDILMSIQTGAIPHAGTTANIEISLGWRGKVITTFIIVQNPTQPRLIKHSTCCTRLPYSTGFLSKWKRPLRLAVWQNGEGRYPSWYCHWIELRDMKNKEFLKFPVKRWITAKPQVFEALPNGSRSNDIRKRFRRKIEMLFINWFGVQPILGPWKYGGDKPLNRGVRTFIWVTKISIIITIVGLYFGPTTMYTYELDRDKYAYVTYNFNEILLLSCFCFLVTILMEIIFVRLYSREWLRSSAL